MEYNKAEEKLISGQPSLKMCFFYNSSHEQEHPICSILLDLIGKSGEKKPVEIFTYSHYVNLEKIVHKDTTYNKVASFATY